MADVLAALDRAQLDGSADAALELALQAARVTTAPGGRASVATRVENLLERPGRDAVLAARALVWSVSHLPADVDDREAFATWTLERVQQAIRTARTSGDTAALLDALELTIRTLPLTLDMELAKAGIAEGLELAERQDDPGRLARFRMWVGMGTLAQGQVEPARALLLAGFAGGSAAGDRVAAEYSAIFLRGMGVADSGSAGVCRCPASATLLESAWRHQDGFAAAIVLGQLVTQALDAGDVGSAAGLALQLLPIGASRLAVEPLPSATMLTVPVRGARRRGPARRRRGAARHPGAARPAAAQRPGAGPDYLAFSAAADRLRVAAPGARHPGHPPSRRRCARRSGWPRSTMARLAAPAARRAAGRADLDAVARAADGARARGAPHARRRGREPGDRAGAGHLEQDRHAPHRRDLPQARGARAHRGGHLGGAHRRGTRRLRAGRRAVPDEAGTGLGTGVDAVLVLNSSSVAYPCRHRSTVTVAAAANVDHRDVVVRTVEGRGGADGGGERCRCRSREPDVLAGEPGDRLAEHRREVAAPPGARVDADRSPPHDHRRQARPGRAGRRRGGAGRRHLGERVDPGAEALPVRPDARSAGRSADAEPPAALGRRRWRRRRHPRPRASDPRSPPPSCPRRRPRRRAGRHRRPARRRRASRVPGPRRRW